MPSNSGYHHLKSHSSNHPNLYQTSNNNTPRPLFVEELCANGVPPPPLKIADSVVWLSDSGPEHGVVKWIGKLPDVSNDWMVGVDFVNPVGSGTGLYNEYKLFETRMNHASLVPIVGLIRESDYMGTTSTNLEQVQPPLKPRRLKKESFKFYPDLKSSKKPTDNEASLNQIASDLIKFSLSKDNLNGTTTTTSPDTILENRTKDFAADSRAVVKLDNNSTVESRPRNDGKESKSPPTTTTTSEELFEIGSVVEVIINQTSYYGVIRWLGFSKADMHFKFDSIYKSDKNFKNVLAGIELEEEISGLTDGTLNGNRLFTCAANKAYFVSLHECLKDSRFTNDSLLNVSRRNSSLFGSIDCPTVLGDVAPLGAVEDDLSRLVGKNRGIQGHHNSCYLDATLFAMFSCTSIFESLLYRPKCEDDIPEYNEVQRILKEEIVNPLRTNLYVRADRVMHLRQLLEQISPVRGLTSEEKDPEEFLNLLLTKILKTDPFLKLSSGLESFFYQLFVEKDENLQIPSVQQLFDQSFLASDIKLRQVPPCLMIQMPRFGREFKMYSRIIPSLQLDITNVLENSPRQCIVCGGLAEFECKECFGKFAEGLESIAFCKVCLEKSHSHKRRVKHKSTKLSIPSEFVMLKNHTNVPRVTMDLFAVLCIETSHYVSFVKYGTEPDSPWCFFDSMADRKGEQNGYNIPEVVAFSDFNWWLSNDGYNYLLNKDDKMIPELPRRLVSDAYICFYSSEVHRYR